ncbi:MAG: chemotaxis protein CheB [Acidimicrobiales bacterium]
MSCPPSVPIRLLLADDSPLGRHIVVEALAGYPGIELVACVGDGPAALRALDEHEVDLVVLDTEMPGMSGAETLGAVRRRHPQVPVVMLASLTRRGAAAALEALAQGAEDYVAKPRSATSLDQATADIRRQLLPKIAALLPGRYPCSSPAPRSDRSDRPGRWAGAGALEPDDGPAGGQDLPPELVVVVAGAGGPAALGALVGGLDPSLAAPVIVHTHLAPVLAEMLCAHLARSSPLPVELASDSAPLVAGGVWVAPGHRQLRVRREGTGTLACALDHEGGAGSVTASCADALLASASEAAPGATVAVVLTGQAPDGLAGALAVRSSGGKVIVQDMASSALWGAAGLVASAGIAERVLPLGDLAPVLMRLGAPAVSLPG